MSGSKNCTNKLCACRDGPPGPSVDSAVFGTVGTPVPTRSTVILALPSLPKGGWRGVSRDGRILQNAAQPLNVCNANTSFAKRTSFIISALRIYHCKVKDFARQPPICRINEISFCSARRLSTCRRFGKSNGVSQDPRPTHLNVIVSVGEHSMLPKNYSKIRGQMISAPTHSTVNCAI